MSIIVIKGVVRDGRVEVDGAIDLPDGTEVTITGPTPGKSAGRLDDDRTPDPGEIAATLAAMDRVEPLELSVEERAAWEAGRRESRQREKAHFEEHAETLRSLWE